MLRPCLFCKEGRLGLRLHPEKTRVVRAEDGFDFLGVRFRLRPVRKRLVKLNGYVRGRLRIFLKRKYSDRSMGSRRVHDNLFVRLGLCQFA